MNRKNGRPLIVPKRTPPTYTDTRVICNERGAYCTGCPFPAHGFVCWFSDGSCLRSAAAHERRERNENGQHAHLQ